VVLKCIKCGQFAGFGSKEESIDVICTSCTIGEDMEDEAIFREMAKEDLCYE